MSLYQMTKEVINVPGVMVTATAHGYWFTKDGKINTSNKLFPRSNVRHMATTQAKGMMRHCIEHVSHNGGA